MENRRQLTIEEIRLFNFKSYGDEKIIGPLDRRMSAVVGPNGSGKSNLIESLLFVFGKKVQWMRLSRLSELIHKRSDDKMQPKQGHVEVVFREADYQLKIKRVVYQNSTTKYYVDGQEKQQKEVVELLKDKGIDLDNNRFLILQGEVEQISLMKPKGNATNEVGYLEYLEELIGSDQFRERIEDYDEAYEEGLEKRREINELVGISWKGLQELEGDKDKAEEYIRTENMMYRYQSIGLQMERYNANLQVIEYEELYEKVRLDYEQQKQRYQGVKQQMVDLQQQKQNASKQYDVLKNREEQQKKVQDDYVMQDSDFKDQLNRNRSNIVKLGKEIEEYDKQIGLLQQKMEEYKIDMPGVQEQVEMLEKEKNKQQEKVKQLESQMEGRIEDKQKEMRKLGLIVRELEQKIQNGKVIVKDSEVKLGQLVEDRQRKGLEQEMQGLKDQEQKQVIVKEQLEGRIREVQMIKDKEQRLVNEYNKEIEQLQKGIKKRQDNIQRMNSSNSSNNRHILDKLWEGQRSGKLKGVIGRLGDLGWIDKKYDVAISTCGQGLNNVVVETSRDAQNAIQYLRDQKVGKMTFLPLDGLRKTLQQKQQQVFNAPQNSKRLYDQVNVKNEEYRIAFYSVLRDTLVVDDIELATKIGYELRMKVISLNGELIEGSGVMSGGGVKRRGIMGFSEGQVQNVQQQQQYYSQREIQQMNGELQGLVQQCQKVEQDVLRGMEHLKQIQKEELGLDNQLGLEKSRLTSIRNAVNEVIGQIENRQSRNVENDIECLKNTIQKVSNEMLQEQHEYKTLQAKVEELQKQINQIGGKQYTEEKRILDRMGEELEIIDKKYLGLTVGNQKAVKDKQVIEQISEEKKKQLQQLKEKNEGLVNKQQQLEKLMEQLLEEEELMLQQQKVLQQKIEELTKKHEEVSQQNNEKMKQIADCQKKMQSYKLQVDENKKNYQNFSTKINEVKKRFKQFYEEYGFLVGDRINDVQMDQTLNISLDQTMNQSFIEEQSKRKELADIFQEVLRNMDFNDDIKQKQLEVLKDLNIVPQIDLQLAYLEESLKQMSPNLKSIQEYREMMLLYNKRKEQQLEIVNQLKSIKTNVEQLKKQRYDMFTKGFTIINQKLRETYQLLTESGDAELELVDSLDPFSEGVVFSVRPPQKSWKQMMKLSGGEKTLSSLAFIFALHHFKPTPLYFMDEIDAALDFKNVAIVAKYLKERTNNAQFIIISLRNNMFEKAHRLVGIYKINHITHTVLYHPQSSTKIEQSNRKGGMSTSNRKGEMLSSDRKGGMLSSDRKGIKQSSKKREETSRKEGQSKMKRQDSTRQQRSCSKEGKQELKRYVQ